MIEFNGWVGNSAKEYLFKKLKRIAIIGSLIVFVLLGVPSLLAIIYFKTWIFLLATICVVIFVFVGFLLLRKETLPKKIIIDEDEIYGEVRSVATTRRVEDVKKVIDLGDFYDIVFYFPNQWSNCICQKDLLVEGTIAEFEKLFEDKIMRK